MMKNGVLIYTYCLNVIYIHVGSVLILLIIGLQV